MRPSKKQILFRLATAAIAVLGLVALAQSGSERKAKPQGPYMGQTPPGTTPMVFAPGFISTDSARESGCTFSPDGKEFYFTRNRNTFFTTLQEKGWSKPKQAPWNTSYADMEPHVTADGMKLVFISNRPEGSALAGIWMMARAGAGWNQPIYHGLGEYATTASNGNLYFTDLSLYPKERIALQRFANGEYGPVEMLGDGVNDPIPAVHPCIAWDESYLIFDGARPDALGGPGDWDFYISFRTPDGPWSPAAHFLEISSSGLDMLASISPDGKYIFFSQNGDIWWVSSEIVERYRPSGSPGTLRQ